MSTQLSNYIQLYQLDIIVAMKMRQNHWGRVGQFNGFLAEKRNTKNVRRLVYIFECYVVDF